MRTVIDGSCHGDELYSSNATMTTTIAGGCSTNQGEVGSALVHVKYGIVSYFKHFLLCIKVIQMIITFSHDLLGCWFLIIAVVLITMQHMLV